MVVVRDRLSVESSEVSSQAGGEECEGNGSPEDAFDRSCPKLGGFNDETGQDAAASDEDGIDQIFGGVFVFAWNAGEEDFTGGCDEREPEDPNQDADGERDGDGVDGAEDGKTEGVNEWDPDKNGRHSPVAKEPSGEESLRQGDGEAGVEIELRKKARALLYVRDALHESVDIVVEDDVDGGSDEEEHGDGDQVRRCREAAKSDEEVAPGDFGGRRLGGGW